MKAPGTKRGFPGKPASEADSGKESSRKRFPRMGLFLAGAKIRHEEFTRTRKGSCENS